uniref:Uncharacterized protein n=1 Tax=Peronospora matthiolae TaxID=2874970 RepID=A0AAV1T665_9STRA
MIEEVELSGRDEVNSNAVRSPLQPTFYRVSSLVTRTETMPFQQVAPNYDLHQQVDSWTSASAFVKPCFVSSQIQLDIPCGFSSPQAPVPYVCDKTLRNETIKSFAAVDPSWLLPPLPKIGQAKQKRLLSRRARQDPDSSPATFQLRIVSIAVGQHPVFFARISTCRLSLREKRCCGQ